MTVKRKQPATPTLAVTPEPDDTADGGATPDAPEQDDAPDPVPDVTVVIPDELDAAPATPAPAPAAAGGSAAVYASSYGTWVVPAPAAATDAPVGSSGFYMGIKLGVNTTPGVYAMLGTTEPREGWPAK